MLRFIFLQMQQRLTILRNFNTSHVTVYHNMGGDIDGYIPFQYIPCYGLSAPDQVDILVKLEFQYIPCYGLSTFASLANNAGLKFQYIPCYGLSCRMLKQMYGTTKFQYIPCYGLSVERLKTALAYRNFNTSHVTVYLRMEGAKKNTPAYFNTSHVTVYRAAYTKGQQIPEFQYIPCYGLSEHELRMHCIL